MKLASALRAASALSSTALLLSIGCGGDFRSSSHSDGGANTSGQSNGGNSGSSNDSGAGGDSAGGAAEGGKSSGGTAGKGAGGANGGRGGSGGARTGGRTGSGGSGGSGAITGSGGGGSGTGGTGGRDTSQHASNYDQNCNLDGQCSLVNDTSDACGCQTCMNAAISSSALAQWSADRKAFNCMTPICPGLPCLEMLAACAKGTCTARKPFIIDANSYDNACAHDSDCTTIPVGEVCAPCQCARGAVSLTGLEQYKINKATVLCSPGPAPCDCAPFGVAKCSLSMTTGTGVCVISSN